ncbi:GTP cyclohydrolase [Curtobacterium sp. Leaf183]|nr:GTP cyclohydrolase [Curtobacterium sp. Leaf183]
MTDALTSPVPGSPVRFEVATNVPTTHGTFEMRAYRDLVTGAEHVAVIGLTPDGDAPVDGALVRVHSECLTGEAFGSLKCECGPQLDAALDTIAAEGGVVVYLRGHEGRGIGLVNKLKAYRLQEDGLDTLDANLALGLPADSRAYGGAAGILADLGIHRVRLLSNNPEKQRQLEEHGIAVDTLVPLVVGISVQNAGYLDTKRDRMGHQLPEHLEAGAHQ